MDAMNEISSYAVAWCAGEVRFVGYAVLMPDALRLSGGGPGGREQLRTIRYEDVSDVDVVRVNSHRELALDLGAELLMVSSLDRPGSLGELTDALRARIGPPANGRRVA